MKRMKKIIKGICVLLVICLIAVVGFEGYKYFKYKSGIPILGYHNVVSDEDKAKYHRGDIYTMAVSDFEKQMKYLSDNQFNTLSLGEVTEWYEGRMEMPLKSVVITFDDGFETFNTIVKPILEKYNLKATCFVIGVLCQDEPDFYEYLKQDQLVNTQNVEYYSHSYNLHVSTGMFEKKIETLTTEEIKQDFAANKGIVDDRYFAYPFGRPSKTSREVLVENGTIMGYGYAQNRRATRSDDRYLMPRFLMYSFMNMTWFKWIVD